MDAIIKKSSPNSTNEVINVISIEVTILDVKNVITLGFSVYDINEK